MSQSYSTAEAERRATDASAIETAKIFRSRTPQKCAGCGQVRPPVYATGAGARAVFRCAACAPSAERGVTWQARATKGSTVAEVLARAHEVLARAEAAGVGSGVLRTHKTTMTPKPVPPASNLRVPKPYGARQPVPGSTARVAAQMAAAKHAAFDANHPVVKTAPTLRRPTRK